MSLGCKPAVGSSRMVQTPTSPEPSCAASRARCSSPPESVSEPRSRRQVVDADFDQAFEPGDHFRDQRRHDFLEPRLDRKRPEKTDKLAATGCELTSGDLDRPPSRNGKMRSGLEPRAPPACRRQGTSVSVRMAGVCRPGSRSGVESTRALPLSQGASGTDWARHTQPIAVRAGPVGTVKTESARVDIGQARAALRAVKLNAQGLFLPPAVGDRAMRRYRPGRVSVQGRCFPRAAIECPGGSRPGRRSPRSCVISSSPVSAACPSPR